MIDMETAVMELIINAGEARSCAMQALYAARKYQWDQVDILLAESQLAAKRAHATQTELIGFDEGEGKLPVNLIMVHAQDHIMNAMLARDLVEELVRIYRLLEQNGVKNQ